MIEQTFIQESSDFERHHNEHPPPTTFWRISLGDRNGVTDTNVVVPGRATRRRGTEPAEADTCPPLTSWRRSPSSSRRIPGISRSWTPHFRRSGSEPFRQ